MNRIGRSARTEPATLDRRKRSIAITAYSWRTTSCARLSPRMISTVGAGSGAGTGLGAAAAARATHAWSRPRRPRSPACSRAAPAGLSQASAASTCPADCAAPAESCLRCSRASGAPPRSGSTSRVTTVTATGLSPCRRRARSRCRRRATCTLVRITFEVVSGALIRSGSPWRRRRPSCRAAHSRRHR